MSDVFVQTQSSDGGWLTVDAYGPFVDTVAATRWAREHAIFWRVIRESGEVLVKGPQRPRQGRLEVGA